MWVNIEGRKNLGTNSKPKLAVLLKDDAGNLVRPESGALTGDALGEYKVRHLPEYGDWVELVPIKGSKGPSMDRLELKVSHVVERLAPD